MIYSVSCGVGFKKEVVLEEVLIYWVAKLYLVAKRKFLLDNKWEFANTDFIIFFEKFNMKI